MNIKHVIAATALAASTFLVVTAAQAEGAGKTCGQMTAENAPMPMKVAEMMIAYADEADAHAAFMMANGKGDKNAQAEADGMKKLAVSYREAAAAMSKTAEMMKTAATWPGAPHDMKKMQADAKLKAAMDKTMSLQKDFGDMVAKMTMPMPAKTADAAHH